MDADSKSRVKQYLQRLDRIMSGRVGLDVCVEQDTRLAHSNLSDGSVHLNIATIETLVKANEGNDFAAFLATTLGFNYHELAHHLFTPKLPVSTTAEVAKAHNQLEDARIESIFTMKYPISAGYFRRAVMVSLLTGSRATVSYPILYGRRAYLGKEIVDESKALFLEYNPDYTAEIPEAERIIDAFLVEPDAGKRLRLAEEFSTLFLSRYGRIPDVYQEGASQCSSKHDEIRREKNVEDLAEDLEDKLKEVDGEDFDNEEDMEGDVEKGSDGEEGDGVGLYKGLI